VNGSKAYWVAYVDSGVDDVGASALPGRVVVRVCRVAGPIAGQACQSPIRVRLCGLDGDDPILLDIIDLVLCQKARPMVE
jgi:hypothetical protein